MHVAAKVGLVAGLGIAGGLAAGRILGSGGDGANASTGASAALVSLGIGGSVYGSATIARLGVHGLSGGLALGTIAASAALAGVGIALLGRDSSPSDRTPRVPAPVLDLPTPSPAPGPAPFDPSIGSSAHDALRGRG